MVLPDLTLPLALFTLLLVMVWSWRSYRSKHTASPASPPPNEETYRTLFEESLDGLFVTSPSGKVLEMNKRCVAMFGYDSKEEIAVLDLGKDIYLDPSERAFLLAKVDRRGAAEAEVTLKRKNGEPMQAFCAITAVWGPSGEVTSYRGVIRDITSRKRDEQALAHSNQLYRTIIHAMTEGVMMIDASGKVLSVNPAAVDILGTPADRLVGLSLRQLSPILVDENERSFPLESIPVLQTLRTGKAMTNVVMGFQLGHPETVWLSVNTQPLVDDKNQLPYAVVSTFTDITARKRRESEREALQKQLALSKKVEAIGRLAGGVAHDFNNLLTVILSYSGSCLDKLLDGDPMRSEVLEIKKAGEKAAALTKQLLAYSRKQVLRPQAVDLNAVFLDTERMLQRIIGEDIVVLRSLDADLGTLHVDPNQMEQIFFNLFVNARDAMPQGGKITVTTANVLVKEGEPIESYPIPPGAYVRLTVEDTGTGMDPDTLSRIFDPFFTTKPVGQGTGLGLPTVYGIVKQSGGFLFVSSIVGSGSNFRIYFPHAALAAPNVTTPAPSVAKHAPSGTILLAEDESALREIVSQTLEKAGYRVITAKDGFDALKTVQIQKFDLLLTDVIMPGLSGYQLAQALHQSQPETKVLFMSGHSDATLAHHGVVEEDVNFLGKPFTPTVLKSKIWEVLAG